jgi:hypothetical protein
MDEPSSTERCKFLASVFAQIRSTSPLIGKVLIEPREDVQPEDSDHNELASELTRLLQEQSPGSEWNWRQGITVAIPERYQYLKKYVRSITLRQDKCTPGAPWVQVEPFGTYY